MDYYQALGVLPTATIQEVISAYKRIAMKTHPDRNPNNEIAMKRFREATEAYEVLSGPVKREEYDRHQLNNLIEDPIAAAKAAWGGFIDETISTIKGEPQ